MTESTTTRTEALTPSRGLRAALLPLLALLAALGLASCSQAPAPPAAAVVDDPYTDGVKAIAAFHDAFDFPTAANTNDAVRLRLAGDARVDTLGGILAELPTPHTREQRYVYARLLAYHSAAAHWIEAQYEATVARAKPAAAANEESERMITEDQLGATVALNEQYDLVAGAERKFMHTSILWDRLRVRRSADQTVVPAELKRRMALADSILAADFAEFD